MRCKAPINQSNNNNNNNNNNNDDDDDDDDDDVGLPLHRLALIQDSVVVP